MHLHEKPALQAAHTSIAGSLGWRALGLLCFGSLIACGGALRPMPESEQKAVLARNDDARKRALEHASAMGFQLDESMQQTVQISRGVVDTCTARQRGVPPSADAKESATLLLGTTEVTTDWNSACTLHSGAAHDITLIVRGQPKRFKPAIAGALLAKHRDGRWAQLTFKATVVKKHVFLEPGRSCCCGSAWSPDVPRSDSAPYHTVMVIPSELNAAPMEIPFDVEALEGACDPSAPQ